MKDSMRKLARYEGEYWFIDISNSNGWIFDRVTRDGIRHPAGAEVSWGYFMEILDGAPCVASPPENPSPEWFINFFKTKL